MNSSYLSLSIFKNLNIDTNIKEKLSSSFQNDMSDQLKECFLSLEATFKKDPNKINASLSKIKNLSIDKVQEFAFKTFVLQNIKNNSTTQKIILETIDRLKEKQNGILKPDVINVILSLKKQITDEKGKPNLLKAIQAISINKNGGIKLKIKGNIKSLVVPQGVKEVDCSWCNNLTSLTIPEGVEIINCSYCSNLSSLTIPKGAKEINCYGCKNITTLSISKDVEKVNCSNCQSLKSLTIPEGVKEVDCSRCKNITTLSIPKGIKKVYCCECKKLSSLTIPEGLECIDCSGCQLLTSLTIPEGVKEIYCSGCHIESLEIPKGTEKVYCYQCHKLQSLTIPEGVKYIDCSGCQLLSSLTIPEGVIYLSCAECQNIQSLSLPQSIQNINFYNCLSLTSIGESLPNCAHLNCMNCPITQLPQLPVTARVFSSIPFNQLAISLDDLQKKPFDTLLYLGNQYLLKNKPFPNLHFTGTKGIDYGGLRRHFISTLFKHLVKDKNLFTGENEARLPLLKKQDREDKSYKNYQVAFRTIGRIFAFCLTHPEFLIGPCFDHSLFKALFKLKDQDLSSLSEELQKKIYCFFKGCSLENLDEDVKNSIMDYIEDQPVVFPAYLIAKELYSSISSNSLKSQIQTADKLQLTIQGETVSKENLLNNIVWETIGNTSSVNINNLKKTFTEWVSSQPLENLTKFVLFTTGNRSIGKEKITLKIYCNRDKKQLPIAHTCSQTIEIPLYSNKEELKNKLNLALSSAEGFHMV